jgi:hypothetical protein
MVYGSDLTIPGQLLIPAKPCEYSNANQFVEDLFQHVSSFTSPVRDHRSKSYVPKALKDAKYVWLKKPIKASSLDCPYTGPYKVLERTDKTITINRHGVPDKVSIDRTKPHIGPDQSPTLPTTTILRTKRSSLPSHSIFLNNSSTFFLLFSDSTSHIDLCDTKCVIPSQKD